jgi:hypothetical protein
MELCQSRALNFGKRNVWNVVYQIGCNVGRTVYRLNLIGWGMPFNEGFSVQQLGVEAGPSGRAV